MKLQTILEIAVLISLGFATALCLSYRKPEEFSRLQNPPLSAGFVSKLKADPVFSNKEELVIAVNSLVESEAAGLDDVVAVTKFVNKLGYVLLSLTLLQSLGLVLSWKSRKA